ncbi:MAG: hypothetical protein QNJ00_16270 [Woeseiaceae bacterium]|nr:hypothetical protein [Woeseiaceae bacterium]
MLSSLRRAGADAAPGSRAPFHAPLFHDLIARLEPDERHVVLDLGVASTAMLALLGQGRCRVEIADLAHFGGVDRLNSMEPGPALVGAGEALLPNRCSADVVDLVFCWDLPNYLTLDALSALMLAIGQRAGPGALAHALIAYSDRDMREEPGCFVPTPDGELMDLSAAGNAVAAPRYSPEDLGMNMGGFVIERARLLSNGMQEFLFRLE